MCISQRSAAGVLVTLLLTISPAGSLAEPGSRDGQLRGSGSELQAWDGVESRWLTIEDFWDSYAARRGGLTWGKGPDYPPYEQVDEHDTFWVIVDSGPCLMEFFHQRWRRANDVRRWDPVFNEYGGCPDVFR